MRDTIKEYIELSDKEKNDLWNTATFVFDTNVFLNLYRYSNKTRNQLIESFEWLKTRIWMPYQVASEFCKDRYSVIDEANKRFDNLSADADKLTDNWREELRLDCSDSDIKELGKYLKEWITKKKIIIISLLVQQMMRFFVDFLICLMEKLENHLVSKKN